MPEKKKVAPVQQGKVPVIYLGPEIPGTVSRGTVFNNGLTAKLEEAAKELPALKMLLVPVKEAVTARKNLKNTASAISVCYKKAAEYAAQKGAKK